jgi:hypothetical protein
MVDNPMYTAWAKFKPGATSSVSEHTTYSGDTNAVPDRKTITYTLLSVSPDKVVVNAVAVEQEVLGTIESAPTKHTYAAKLKKSYLAKAAPELQSKKGEETITWEGKEIKCRTLSGSYKKEGDTVEFKFWINDGVPGGFVKQTRTLKQKDDTTTTRSTLQSSRRKSRVRAPARGLLRGKKGDLRPSPFAVSDPFRSFTSTLVLPPPEPRGHFLLPAAAVIELRVPARGGSGRAPAGLRWGAAHLHTTLAS